MKITYTGEASFSPVEKKKLDVKFAKLGKLLDRGGEKGAHVIVTSTRHLHRAEITTNYYDHPFVGMGSHADCLHAVTEAVDHLEKQLMKLKQKYRDVKRSPQAKALLSKKVLPPAAEPETKKAARVKVAKSANDQKRVHRVNDNNSHKPMTVDEAMLEINKEQDYLVYRDSETDRMHVLVKRRDGHFDLIES